MYRALILAAICCVCFSVPAVAEEDPYYKERMRRNHAIAQQQIDHAREMQKLELQYRILVEEKKLGRDHFVINNSTRSAASARSKARTGGGLVDVFGNLNDLEPKQLLP